MESCFSVKEPLAGTEDTGIRTDCLQLGWDPTVNTRAENYKYLNTCEVHSIPAFSNVIFCVNACQLESYVTVAVVTNPW